MTVATERSFTLPLAGLHCVACVGRVEQAVADVDGVVEAAVNLADETLAVHADSQVKASDVAAAVQAAGYDVPAAEYTLQVAGMHCVSCVGRVESGLAEVPGVLDVAVNLASGQALVRHALGQAEPSVLRAAVERSGFPAVNPGASGPGSGFATDRSDSCVHHLENLTHSESAKFRFMRQRDVFSATPLDRESIPQGSLDITKRVRTNLFPWNGQFSPQLVEELLTAYAPRNGVVLDPFVGSGTLLVEAARLGLSACGSDINPAAIILAEVYRSINLDEAQRANILSRLRSHLFGLIGPPYAPLYSHLRRGPLNRDALESALVELWRETTCSISKTIAASLVILCDFHQRNLDSEIAHKTWMRLERTVRTLPKSDRPISVHHADARELPFESDSVDMVITSPPYINVHNYHQKFRRSVEALNWNVLAIARSEIGSNRQNRVNRFLTVTQYSLDMALSLREMARVAKAGARLILVLGRESSVRGTAFFNGELVAEVAVRGVGLTIERRQERVFRNRFGIDVYEDILHFRAPTQTPERHDSLKVARSIAAEALSAARSRVPDKERDGLDDALSRFNEVMPSPAAVSQRVIR